MFLEKFTPLAKKFTLPAAVTAVTNLTSGWIMMMIIMVVIGILDGDMGDKCDHDP